MVEGKVMVEAPRRLPTIANKGHLSAGNVTWCTRCSLSESNTPIAPSSIGIGDEWAIIGPHPEAWCVDEVARLVRLMRVESVAMKLSTIYCPVESPTDHQRAQCQVHVETFMRLVALPLVVVVGRMAPVSLGFDPRAVLSGRVGIWHDPLDAGAGCFCLFVDAPDGHNNHKVLDQLYPLPAMLNGDMSLMRLVGAGRCAFGECNASTFVLDKTGIPWCRGHEWGGVDDGRKMKKRKGQHNRGVKGRGKK